MGLMDYLSITPTVASQANRITGVPTPPTSASNDKIVLPNFDKAKLETSSSTDVDFNKLIREKGYYGAFQSLNKKPDFEGEEKRTRRARELALLGDIANLGGQALASSMGVRRFAPINSQVPQYNERLQRLRDARRSYDTDFNNKSLSMIFKDYEQKRNDDTLKSQSLAKQAAADLKLKRDLALKQIDQAFQVGMLDAKGKQTLGAQAERAKSDKELESLKHKYRLGEIKAVKKDDKGKSSNGEEMVYVYNENGQLEKTPSRFVTDNKYWDYAKNALVASGVIKSTASDDEVYQAMKDRGVYVNPALKELNSKTGDRLFGGATDAPWLKTSGNSVNAPWVK